MFENLIPSIDPTEALIAGAAGYSASHLIEWVKKNPKIAWLAPNDVFLINLFKALFALGAQVARALVLHTPMDAKSLGTAALLAFITYVSAELNYHATIKQ